jgi:hypothetical protein
MDSQEHHNEDPNQHQRMVGFFTDRLVEPIDEFLHPLRRFEWRGGFKHNPQTLTIRAKGLDMVRYFLVVPAMLLILAAVFEKNTVKLLDVVFGDRFGLETLENHVHRIGVASHFLLVPAREQFSLHTGEQLFHFPVAELRMEFRLAELENPARQHGIRLGQVATRQNAINELKRASIVMLPAALLRVRPRKGNVPTMSPDQELLNLAGAESESKTLFDELAGLVPAERQAEYYRVIAHTRTLSPNDEMLRVLEAMGILALLTRETPAAIAVERTFLQRILENAASKADEVENRMAAYTSRLESRIAQLPKELETGLNPSRIAKLLGESLRHRFQQSGLPDAARALDQSCADVNSVQKQLVNVLREVAHPEIGVIAKVRSANDALLRSMTTRAQQIDDLLGRLEKQVWAIWLPVVASAALALGFFLGTWFASERQATPETPSAAQAQQEHAAPDVPPRAIPQRSAKHR